MALAYLNLSVTQYINFMCKTDFERRIYHDTYREFQKKSKIYSLNLSLNTFSQMCDANEKANSLHHKLHYSVMHTLESLENKIPVLQDEDKKQIRFDWVELQIHSSDLLNKAGHIIALTYTSPKLILHEIIGNLLLLSYDRDDIQQGVFMVEATNDLIIQYEESRQLIDLNV